MNRSYRPALIVGGYGALAGVMAAMTYILMEHVQHLLWQNPYAQGPLYTIAVIMGGGLLLSLLYRLNATAPSDLNAQLQQAHDPLRQKKRATLLTALIAIVSVGFGGAVGPEAGLIAVVSECSAILALHLARNQAEQRLIGDSGSIAALSGLYGAPPGAATLIDEDDNGKQAADSISLPLKLLAGISGMAGFYLTTQLLLDGGFQQLTLPAHTIPRNGSDLLLAIPRSPCRRAAGITRPTAAPPHSALVGASRRSRHPNPGGQRPLCPALRHNPGAALLWPPRSRTCPRTRHPKRNTHAALAGRR